MGGSAFHDLAEVILQQRRFAVVGASRDPNKYGHKVYVALKQHGYEVYPVHPVADRVAGDVAYPLLDNLPERPDCVVTVVSPVVTEQVLRDAWHLRIPYGWMQPGSESEAAVNEARAYGMEVIWGGPCILVALAERAARHE